MTKAPRKAEADAFAPDLPDFPNSRTDELIYEATKRLAAVARAGGTSTAKAALVCPSPTRAEGIMRADRLPAGAARESRSWSWSKLIELAELPVEFMGGA